MIVDLTLYHNSEATFGAGSRGAKWAIMYDACMQTDTSGNMKMAWGDGRHYVFAKVFSAFISPPGVHEAIAANGGSINGYDLLKKDQTKWHFAPYGTSGVFYLTTITDENGNVITINRAANGGSLSVTDPTGRTATFGFNSTYYTSITDPLGHIVSFGFDGNGNMSTVTYPVLNGTSYTLHLGYNTNHDITSYQDLRGNTATYLYNSDDSVAWEKDALLNQTSFSYTATTATVTDPNGHTITHTYNSSGQLSQVTDAIGNSEYYTYDFDDNKTVLQDRRGNYWRNTYDNWGNQLTTKDPNLNTTTYTYNSSNKPLTITQPSGRSIANTYDGHDNLTQVQEKDASGTVKATTGYTIGSYGLVSVKTDPNGHHTSYGYNANGYLNSVTTHLGHQTQWTYDAMGFKTSRIDAMGRTTYYTPDTWERLVTTTYPDSTTKTFTYDANSNLTGFANYLGGWSRAYDADNRLLNEYYASTRLVNYSYDATGQKGLLSTTTDVDGRVLTYGYSSRNELSSVSEAAGTTTYAYDANGNQTHLYLPNGLRTDQYYNTDNTLDSYYNWDGVGSIWQSYGYSYNADHQITSANEGQSGNVHGTPNPTQTTYGYDSQGHLTGETRTGVNVPFTKSYILDPAGNRLSMNEGGTINALSYDADDALQTVGSYSSYTYNANGDQIGSIVNGQSTTFGYDFDDQLTTIAKPGSSLLLAYDPLGRQCSRTVNGALTGLYSDGDHIVTERNASGVTIGQYTWGNGLIRFNGEYPLYDGRGSSRLTTDISKNILSTNVRDAFGRTVSTAGSTGNVYGYHGAEGYRSGGDGPAGGEPYQKVGARYYDATFGRFITRDTDLSQNAYQYCEGDPINFSDPSGHKKKWWQQLFQAISNAWSAGGRFIAGGFTAYKAGTGILSGYDKFQQAQINNDALTKMRESMSNYSAHNPDADMTSQENAYRYAQQDSIRAGAGLAAEAGNTYYHGISGIR